MCKYFSLIFGVVVLVAAVGISKGLRNKKKPVLAKHEKMLPLAFTQLVKNSDMPVTIPASGSLTAKNKIKLYSEVQGVLQYSSNEFKEGVKFKKGEIIYKLNSDEFYTNLLAQKSSFQNLIVSMMPDLRLDYKESFGQWQSYLDNFDITKSLQKLPEPLSNKEKLFVSAKNVNANYYTIKNLEIKLGKYAIAAPFNGVLTVVNVTPGSLVSPGQAIGEFVDTDIYEMEVAINNSLVSILNVGEKVEVQNLENEDEVYTGKIARINQKVDLTSQTVSVFIDLSGKNLKDGMYLKALLKSKVLDNISEVPRNLLVNQNQLYVVNDSLLHLVDVNVVYQNENSIMVRGLKDNQRLLSKPVPKAFEGMKVSTYKEKK